MRFTVVGFGALLAGPLVLAFDEARPEAARARATEVLLRLPELERVELRTPAGVTLEIRRGGRAVATA